MLTAICFSCWTRFSPSSVQPNLITSFTLSRGTVLVTITSLTSFSGLLARAQADAMFSNMVKLMNDELSIRTFAENNLTKIEVPQWL